MNECVYKFMAYYMGVKTDGALHFRPVEHNGLSFGFLRMKMNFFDTYNFG